MCSFESPTICGYQQSKSDKFDWTRASGQTVSVGTGPANDHTYNTPYGKNALLICLLYTL